MEVATKAPGSETREELRAFLEAESRAGGSESEGSLELGYSVELWRKLAIRGALGAAFSPEVSRRTHGTPFDASDRTSKIRDAFLVLEELSRLRIPSPFLTTVLLCGRAIDEYGSIEQREAFLGPIADGRMLLSFADTERGGG